MKLGTYINGWINGAILILAALVAPAALKTPIIVLATVVMAIWMVIYQFVKKPIMYESLALFILYAVWFLVLFMLSKTAPDSLGTVAMIFGLIFVAAFTGLFFFVKSKGGNITETDDDDDYDDYDDDDDYDDYDDDDDYE